MTRFAAVPEQFKTNFFGKEDIYTGTSAQNLINRGDEGAMAMQSDLAAVRGGIAGTGDTVMGGIDGQMAARMGALEGQGAAMNGAMSGLQGILGGFA